MSTPSLIPIGIDLGTTFSVLAHLDPEGRPWTVRNAEGDITTPSVVFFDRTSVIVGKEAVKAASLEPDRVAICAKRDIGSVEYSRTIHGQHIPPEVVEACVLRKLKADAELTLGPIHKVVITVPAYFNEPRRKATVDAGRLVGLEVIDIINEPTAAAIAYGVQRNFLTKEGAVKETERLLVYDLGGGTFDVTLMEISGRDFKTVATAGDVYLGGMDWDRRIADFLADSFLSTHHVDLRQDEAAMVSLLKEAEEAKRALTAREEISIPFQHEGKGIRARLSRAQFEELTNDLVERTRFTSRKVLRDAGLKWTELTRLLVVGGLTRMPMITRMLQEELGRPVDRSLSADEAVAHGAAVYAGFLLAGQGGIQQSMAVGSVSNVNSHDLGVLGFEPNTGRPRNRVLIPRNSTLPAMRAGRFYTQQHGQLTVDVNVIEGGDASGNNSTPIGVCTVSGLPASLPARTKVDVVFRLARDGRLTVHALLPDVGCQARMKINRASGLTEEMLQHWSKKLAAEQFIPGDEPAPADAAEAVEWVEPIEEEELVYLEPIAETEPAAEQLPSDPSAADAETIVDDNLARFLKNLRK